MSESEGEFECSQVSNSEYYAIESLDYGGDIVDEEYNNDDNEVISLESNDIPTFEVDAEGIVSVQSRRIIYDNVEIEDISSDEEVDKW